MFQNALQARQSGNAAPAAGGLMDANAAGLRLTGRNCVCERENAWRFRTRRNSRHHCPRLVGDRLSRRQMASHSSRQPVVFREKILRNRQTGGYVSNRVLSGPFTCDQRDLTGTLRPRWKFD